MSKGYIVFLLDVEDEDRYAAYGQAATPIVMRHRARPLVIGAATDVLEGEWPAGRLVILEFESTAAARAWYDDPDYQALIPERVQAARSRVLLIEGFTMPGDTDPDGEPGGEAEATMVGDYSELAGAEFYDTPAFTGATGGAAGGVTITGVPASACGASGAPGGDDANPGNGHCWYSGADQSPPMPTQLLDLSEGVATFGVSFSHFSQAGINATAAARLRVYARPGGEGPPLGEAHSSGGSGVVDFVALTSGGPSPPGRPYTRSRAAAVALIPAWLK